MVDKRKQLEALKRDLELEADRLPLINKSTDVIFGEGSPETEMVFIGEAGGYWEAKLRRPFVGNAGKLLDQLLVSVGLERSEVYITNVIKARPPLNRDPFPEEVEAFRPYLDKEIKIINPKIIVTLGRFSMNKFLPGESISRIHGQARFVEFSGRKIIVIPMYHPAAALRSLTILEQLRKDFQKIPALLKQPEPIEETRKSEDNNEQLNLIN